MSEIELISSLNLLEFEPIPNKFAFRGTGCSVEVRAHDSNVIKLTPNPGSLEKDRKYTVTLEHEPTLLSSSSQTVFLTRFSFSITSTLPSTSVVANIKYHDGKGSVLTAHEALDLTRLNPKSTSKLRRSTRFDVPLFIECTKLIVQLTFSTFSPERALITRIKERCSSSTFLASNVDSVLLQKRFFSTVLDTPFLSVNEENFNFKAISGTARAPPTNANQRRRKKPVPLEEKPEDLAFFQTSQTKTSSKENDGRGKQSEEVFEFFKCSKGATPPPPPPPDPLPTKIKPARLLHLQNRVPQKKMKGIVLLSKPTPDQTIDLAKPDPALPPLPFEDQENIWQSTNSDDPKEEKSKSVNMSFVSGIEGIVVGKDGKVRREGCSDQQLAFQTSLWNLFKDLLLGDQAKLCALARDISVSNDLQRRHAALLFLWENRCCPSLLRGVFELVSLSSPPSSSTFVLNLRSDLSTTPLI
eukprot:TRINITY_DN2580_c0_g4_i2.p1 TRINITY_DN2580_c0_g4~~TRINITY_DN2580_c0_g4_i2.p1  ORF type:complete len:470 (+),score=142.72 TRINITY_DN2580_c0_g4_i2:85-1494(+)